MGEREISEVWLALAPEQKDTVQKRNGKPLPEH
jgi:hypothetical protein